MNRSFALFYFHSMILCYVLSPIEFRYLLSAYLVQGFFVVLGPTLRVPRLTGQSRQEGVFGIELFGVSAWTINV